MQQFEDKYFEVAAPTAEEGVELLEAAAAVEDDDDEEMMYLFIYLPHSASQMYINYMNQMAGFTSDIKGKILQ